MAGAATCIVAAGVMIAAASLTTGALVLDDASTVLMTVRPLRDVVT